MGQARWYNALQLMDRDFEIREWYWDICRAPVVLDTDETGARIPRYIDLALDIFIDTGGTATVLDVGEYCTDVCPTCRSRPDNDAVPRWEKSWEGPGSGLIPSPGGSCRNVASHIFACCLNPSNNRPPWGCSTRSTSSTTGSLLPHL